MEHYFRPTALILPEKPSTANPSGCPFCIPCGYLGGRTPFRHCIKQGLSIFLYSTSRLPKTEVSFTGYLPGIFFPSGGPVCSETMLNFSVQDSEKASNNKLSFASTSTLSDGGSEDPDDLTEVHLRTLSPPHQSELPFIPHLINQSYNTSPIQVKSFLQF
ncbi:MAG: hypothetical protein AB2L20_20580 [Mangrovibacterium sp.]